MPIRWRIFPFDWFDNLSIVRKIDVPLLILHGTEDEIIAPWHGRRLYEEAISSNKRIEWFPGAHHNDLVRVAGPKWRKVLSEFFAAVAAE